jgi:hypothetical protein
VARRKLRKYRLELLEPPNEKLRHRREVLARDDSEAIGQADELYGGFAKAIRLDRYVLYEGDPVVHEYMATRSAPYRSDADGRAPADRARSRAR